MDFHQTFYPQERLTSHGGGIGLTSGSSAYTGHTTSSGGRTSSLSSSQHGHGPSSHQPADFQPPYFPPPFHHPSTHQSSPQQQQQVRWQHMCSRKRSCLNWLTHLVESSWTRLLEPIQRSLRSNAALFRSPPSYIVTSSSLQSTRRSQSTVSRTTRSLQSVSSRFRGSRARMSCRKLKEIGILMMNCLRS